MPILEWCGALLLTQFYAKVVSFFYYFKVTFLFCGSTIVLSWLHRSPHLLKTFVANRIIAILENSQLDMCHYNVLLLVWIHYLYLHTICGDPALDGYRKQLKIGQ